MSLYREFKASANLFGKSILIISLYIATCYYFGQVFFTQSANSSLIIINNEVRGSYLLSQKVKDDSYFRPRPNDQISNKCDLAVYHDEFKNFINENYDAIVGGHPNSSLQDVTMLSASTSLLDPYITLVEALKQAQVIAQKRSVEETRIVALIHKHSLPRRLPFFTTNIVNTNLLNVDLATGNF